MRMLFTFVGGSGHFRPLVPLAEAVAAAGHVVAFAASPARRAEIEAAGFAAFPVGPESGPPERRPLLVPDREREDHDLREGFVRRMAARNVPEYLELFGRWRPDVVVCEEVDFGGVLAAEKLGLPYANVQVIASGSFIRPEVVGEALGELRAAHGLPADPDLVMRHRHLLLSPFPPSLRDPAFPLPDNAFPIRPPVGATARSDKPTVYFTLGTVFNSESGDLFARVLDGLEDLPVDVIATVGHHVDPAEFGVRRPGVRIERYVPQDEILPRCDLVISHGGSGSVVGTLAHGLPMVLVPLGADQPHNADQCVRLGVAGKLDPVTATPEDVRAVVHEVLTNPDHRRAAERVRAEILGLPEPARAVPLLERLAGPRDHPLSAPDMA
ncbi:glycosyltransferase [Saccharothrix violaceirubra]|uniref:UDP:flavonoid glycosyltransferase YjiC (YdhE family) n=1 Tax=Saccharothrix violaceirubra TaxID=413306 RepID=A0A7W7WX09_9PSEU|nr:glycosyltransferase [Saccharothrix violaceirubra]MBB4966949.1 UDP:flavonoid glycosyltransferase YjiC (YdhE family) [Saccharothrix violaceirubra]